MVHEERFGRLTEQVLALMQQAVSKRNCCHSNKRCRGMATAGTVETSLRPDGRQVQRNPQTGQGSKGEKCKQVNVIDEQEKAGEDADKDFGGLSNALRDHRFWCSPVRVPTRLVQ